MFLHDVRVLLLGSGFIFSLVLEAMGGVGRGQLGLSLGICSMSGQGVTRSLDSVR